MPNVELSISLPALVADRLAHDAAVEKLSVERHAVRILVGDLLRRDADRYTAWVAAHAREHAAKRRAAAADEIERAVATLVDEGMDPALEDQWQWIRR